MARSHTLIFGQSETVHYLKGCQTTSHTQWDNVRLFSTSMVVRQLHKHDRTKWDYLVPQGLSDNFTNTIGQSETVWYLKGCQTTSQTRWDKVRLVSTSVLSYNFTNTMGQSETVYYLKGCQTTSQTQWDNVRLFSTSRVVRQLNKHDGKKLDCLVPQWWSDNFTNTMGQSETVQYLKGGQISSQTLANKLRLFGTSRVVRQLRKHDGTNWDCLVHQGL